MYVCRLFFYYFSLRLCDVCLLLCDVCRIINACSELLPVASETVSQLVDQCM